MTLILEDSPIPNRTSRKLVSPNTARNLSSYAHDDEDRKSLTETPSFNEDEKAAFDKEFQDIIRLTSQKKINPKNAFHFKYVDSLEKMYSKCKEGNFDVYCNALDAGVTIYTCQIDSLHEETMNEVRIMNEMRTQRKIPSKETEAVEEVGKTDKPKKKKNKPTILEDPDSVNRKNIGDRIRFNTSYLKNDLKSNKEVIPYCVLNPYTLAYELGDHKNFLIYPKANESDFKKIEVSKLYFGEDIEVKILPEFNLDFQTEISTRPSTKYQAYVEGAIEDIEEPDETVGGMEEFHEDSEAIERIEEFDGYTETIERCELGEDDIQDGFEKLTITMDKKKSCNTRQISSLIISKQSEYSYFEEPALRKWFDDTKTSTSVWNPFKGKKETDTTAQTQVKTRGRKRKGKKKIDFSNLEILNTIRQRKGYRRKCKLVQCSMWEDLEEILEFDDQRLITYNTWESEEYEVQMSMDESSNKSDEEHDVDMDDNYFNKNYDEEIPEDLDSFLLQEENIFEEAEINETEGYFLGNNLVEAPEQVVVTNMPAEVREPYLDIKKLKKQIWDVIKDKIKNRETVALSYVGIALQNFNFPIIFNALLHLANEERLNIEGDEDLQISYIPPLEDKK